MNAFRKFSSEIKLARIDKSINLSIIEAISEETEKKILKDLEKFENKKQYNQKGITLGKLATQLHTNVKYLSLIIKKYKTDNFNLYINKLRIDYIVDKLENDTNYRKFKISYLSDECGYSSPAAFTRAFSGITGVNPSSYIKLLGDEKENKV